MSGSFMSGPTADGGTGGPELDNMHVRSNMQVHTGHNQSLQTCCQHQVTTTKLNNPCLQPACKLAQGLFEQYLQPQMGVYIQTVNGYTTLK